MKKIFRSAIAATACLLAALPVQAALVPNGDFEIPTTALGQGLIPGTHIGNAGQGWTVVGNAPVNVHHVDNGLLWNGTQFLDLTGDTLGDPNSYGGITSDPITTINGQQYQVNFDAYNGSLIFPGTASTGPAFSLQASGSLAVNYTLATSVNTPLTYLFTANATSTTLTFMDLTGFDSNAGWIDNVSLTAVPEPTTMIAGALLLLPFGASTIRFFRKHRTA